MSELDLIAELLSRLEKIGLYLNCRVVFRPYSKSYYGRYMVKTNVIVLYLYKDPECTMLLPINELFKHLIHEGVHCKQYSDPLFIRYHGVMHDIGFKQSYSFYMNEAKKYNYIGGTN